MPYVPQPGYVMCQPLKKEAVTASGLALPPSEQERGANIGEVEAVGGDLVVDGSVRYVAPDLKQGDLIAYAPYTDIEVEDGSSFSKLVFVPFDKIVAIKKSVQNEGAN